MASDLLLGETIGPGLPPKDEIRRRSGSSTPLPHAFVLAVTATSIHVFSFKVAFIGGMKLKDELGAFDREGLQLDVQEHDVLTVYHINAPQQGQDMMFEMMGGKAAGGEYTRELASMLRDS